MTGTATDRGLDAASLLALALWTGGLTTLGAVVAPLVFGIVPAPASADAMTAVFTRFDSVACACALVVVLAEAARAVRGRVFARLDVLRASLACIAAGIAIVQSVAISPRIVALHRAGAIRGLNDAGKSLESLHHVAESMAKVELTMLVAVLVLHALAPRRVS